MLTIFATPKPFGDPHIATIQRNAVTSWTKLGPECDLLLLGDDPGTAELARELSVRHFPKVERNSFGTPLVRSLFTVAGSSSGNDILAYVNSDVILMSDFVEAVRKLASEPRFLMVGLRWDLNVNEPIDFEASDWEDRLRMRLTSAGRVNETLGGSDFFVFRKGMWGDIPPLALGRYVWDNWLIYGARALGIPVIDATPVVTAVHQDHDYGHHPEGRDGIAFSRETWMDVQAAGGPSHLCTLFDVDLALTPAGVKALEMTEARRQRRQQSRALEAEWIDELQRRNPPAS